MAGNARSHHSPDGCKKLTWATSLPGKLRLPQGQCEGCGLRAHATLPGPPARILRPVPVGEVKCASRVRTLIASGLEERAHRGALLGCLDTPLRGSLHRV